MDNAALTSTHISCCFTGHRPEHLPWGQDENSPGYSDFYLRLSRAIEEMVEKGCRIFYCGMARGVDIIAAQIVLGLREARPAWGLQLIAVCPHGEQAARWSVKDKHMHQFLLCHANETVVLVQSYTPFCFHQRNRYMVDRCDCVIAGYDGHTKGGTASTVQYAKRRGKQVVVVSPV